MIRPGCQEQRAGALTGGGEVRIVPAGRSNGDGAHATGSVRHVRRWQGVRRHARHGEGLLALRAAIFGVAADSPAVGRIEETLKWGQPAYLTPETGSGSTIRLGVPKSVAHDYALFVNCNTDLTRQFAEIYPGSFTYEGTRALLFKSGDPPDAGALKHCIGLALTYHARKR